MVVSVAASILWQRYRAWVPRPSPGVNRFVAVTTFCTTVYWLNLLPYLGVARSTFLYHVRAQWVCLDCNMMPPSFFAPAHSASVL